MDTLKDVLLVFTVVLLVYVLYQRLLQVLGKKEKSTRYAAVSESMQLNERRLKMTVEAERAMSIEIAIKQGDGKEWIRLDDRHLEIGSHAVEIDCASLTTGRYYVWLKTPYQEYSRYFEITE